MLPARHHCVIIRIFSQDNSDSHKTRTRAFQKEVEVLGRIFNVFQKFLGFFSSLIFIKVPRSNVLLTHTVCCLLFVCSISSLERWKRNTHVFFLLLYLIISKCYKWDGNKSTKTTWKKLCSDAWSHWHICCGLLGDIKRIPLTVILLELTSWPLPWLNHNRQPIGVLGGSFQVSKWPLCRPQLLVQRPGQLSGQQWRGALPNYSR